jgi:hypothetical protein
MNVLSALRTTAIRLVWKFSRAWHLRPFEQPESEFFNILVTFDIHRMDQRIGFSTLERVGGWFLAALLLSLQATPLEIRAGYRILVFHTRYGLR